MKELTSQAMRAIAREMPHFPRCCMQKLATKTQTVQPIIPALAPRAMSAACSELPKCPAMITAAAITAGKAAKIPAKDFQGSIWSMIKQAATAVPPKTNLKLRSLMSAFITCLHIP